MHIVSQEVIDGVVEILGESGISADEIESRVTGLVSDPPLARRLIDCIPEAFGLVMMSHIGKVVLPTTFSARDRHGKWKSFPFSSEPIFDAALKTAERMIQDGAQTTFQNVATRSSMVSSLNKALHQGANIDGMISSGPFFIGIPAETYPEVKKNFWQKLFS